MKIAVIGSTMMDVVSYVDKIPEAGETRAVREFHTAGGGKGANQAIAASKLGANVLFVTCVGDDTFGEACMKNYMKAGIDTGAVVVAEGMSNGVATILVEEETGQNRIMICTGANDALTPEMLHKFEEDISKCGLIVLQLEIPIETVYEAINIGNKYNIPVLLNPAPANAALDIDMACKCEFFVPNETELSILTSMPTDTVEQIQKASKTLLDRGLKNVIVTMGSRGSMWFTHNGEELVEAETVKAVDSTGAGDSFIGCFVETWSRTKDILFSMKRASKYAADSVTKKGTQDSYATKDEFLF